MDEKQKMSEVLRESREYDRQYWNQALADAKSGGGAMGEALEVIAHLHAALVDNQPLSGAWETWVGKWLELHDRLRQDQDEFASIVLSANVHRIGKPTK